MRKRIIASFLSIVGLITLTGCPALDLCANVICDEGSTCNLETGVCVNDPVVTDPCDGVTCNDNSNCTKDSCADGNCVFADICGDADCVNGECVVDPCDGVDCDDDDACTDDSCSDGECINENITCDDGDACTEDACDPASGCSNTPCEGELVCVEGVCTDLCDGVDCDDDDACTDDSCSGGECINESITCDDGYTCLEGECVDTCEVVNFECNTGFVCDHGACVEDLCADGDPICLVGFTCNPVTGVCDPNDECAAAGTVCADDMVCVNGECVDLCLDVTCEAGFTCDTATGECV